MLTAFCFLFEWRDDLLCSLSPLAIGEKVNISREHRHSFNISNKGKVTFYANMQTDNQDRAID